MNDTLFKADARGSLGATELEPGHLHVQVAGHLTREVGEVFPAFAREAAKNAERCVVYLDARALRGFDGDVRQAWLDVVLAERSRIDAIIVATRGVFVSISARAAAVALRAFGVHFEIVSNDDEFEALLESRGEQGALVRAA